MRLTSSLLAVAVASVVACTLSACGAPPQVSEGRTETRIPVTAEAAEDVRLAVFWDAAANKAGTKVGTRTVKSDAELQAILTEARNDFLALQRVSPVVSVDAAGEVPWSDLVHVISICKKAGCDRVEFIVP